MWIGAQWFGTLQQAKEKGNTKLKRKENTFVPK